MNRASAEENSPAADVIIAKSNDFRLMASSRDDRQQHHLFAVGSGSDIELLASLEGTSNEVWPVSPAIQEYLRHAEEGSIDCLLGVGNSGTTHYSASLRLELNEAKFTAEFAARIKLPAERLSTVYSVPQEIKIIKLSDQLLQLKYGPLTWQLDANPGTTIDCDDEERKITIANNTKSETTPTTSQWGFQLTSQ